MSRLMSSREIREVGQGTDGCLFHITKPLNSCLCPESGLRFALALGGTRNLNR